MPLKPILSEADKREIGKKLIELCNQFWGVNGYKKTSVQKLCASAGISIGTFYSLFPTKEDLFAETIEGINERLRKQFLDSCRNNPSKEGFLETLKDFIREYDKNAFLYDVNKPDFQSFVSKLSAEALEKIKFDSVDFFRSAVRTANLTLKIDEYKAFGILGALFATIFVKDTISITCDYFTVFDFMVDNLIPHIFLE